MKKNTIILLLVLVFIAVGFLFINKNNPDNITDQPENPGIQGKIDINAVCEGALAYMSFPDSESAEKFITECKEGKHPQVIEDFKKQQGLGDGANI